MSTAAQAPTSPVPARDRKAPLAALLTVVLWASAFVGIRYAGRGLSPGPLALTRLVLASAALGVVMLVRREPLVRRPGIAGVVVCGVMWRGCGFRSVEGSAAAVPGALTEDLQGRRRLTGLVPDGDPVVRSELRDGAEQVVPTVRSVVLVNELERVRAVAFQDAAGHAQRPAC